MIRTLIVDDEHLALNLLEHYISQMPDLTLVGRHRSPMAARNQLLAEEVDLMFLDIQMPEMKGTDLLAGLDQAPITIFTTAYDQYALKAFDLHAVDYLLKPFSFDRFSEAVSKARPHLQAPSSQRAAHRDFIGVKVDGNHKKIFYPSILFIEGLREYVKIVCTDQHYVVYGRLQELEESLPKDLFIRTHKSYLVAKNQVSGQDGNSLIVGAFRVPVSRRKKQEVLGTLFSE